MPRVPVHTNAEGAFLLKGTTTYTTSVPSGSSTVNSSSYTSSVSYKSPTVDGLFVGGTGFRKPTTYSRGCQRIDSIQDFDFWTRNSAGFRNFHFVGSDSRISGFTNYPISGPADPLSGNPGVGLSIQNRAVAEALIKVKDQKLHLGVALAEARRTISMIAQTMISILRIYRALRVGNWNLAYLTLFGKNRTEVNRTFSSPQDAWLAWQYGWSPLLNDIYNGIELVNSGMRNRLLLFSVIRTVTQNLDTGLFGSTNRPDLVITGSAKSSSQVKLFGKVVSEQFYLSSLGLTNPLEIGWELLPYSFVLDWLLPVGNWLSSLDAGVGVLFVGGCRTDKTWWDIQQELAPAYGSTYRKLEGSLPRCRNRGVVMRRTAYGSWPWAFPYWVNPLTTTHTASAIALLAQTRR